MRFAQIVALSCLALGIGACGKKKATTAATVVDTSGADADAAQENAGAEVRSAMNSASNSSDSSESAALTDGFMLVTATDCPVTNACVANADKTSTVTRTFASPCSGATTDLFSLASSTVVCGKKGLWIQRFTQHSHSYDGMVDAVTYNTKTEPVLKLDGTTATRTITGSESVSWSIPASTADGGTFTRTASTTTKSETRSDISTPVTITLKELAVTVSYDSAFVHDKWVVNGEIDVGSITTKASDVTHLLGSDGKRCKLPSSGSDVVTYTDAAGVSHTKTRKYGTDAVPPLAPDADGCFTQWVRTVDAGVATAQPKVALTSGEAWTGGTAGTREE